MCLRILGWAEILQISGLDWTNGIGLVLQNSGIVLEKVCEYLCYNEKNKDQNAVPDMEIPPELCLELLMAADYLDSRCFHLPRAFHANMSQNVLAYEDDQLEIKDPLHLHGFNGHRRIISALVEGYCFYTGTWGNRVEFIYNCIGPCSLP